MNCPICKQDGARRSRRQTAADHVLGVIGVYPWRCKSCNARFYARLMSFYNSLHAHCPICGNAELKRISPENVNSAFGFVWRSLHIPAFRCEPCRHKYFSVRPLQHQAKAGMGLSSRA